MIDLSRHAKPHFDAAGWCMCGRACCVDNTTDPLKAGTCLCEGCRDKVDLPLTVQRAYVEPGLTNVPNEDDEEHSNL